MRLDCLAVCDRGRQAGLNPKVPAHLFKQGPRVHCGGVVSAHYHQSSQAAWPRQAGSTAHACGTAVMRAAGHACEHSPQRCTDVLWRAGYQSKHALSVPLTPGIRQTLAGQICRGLHCSSHYRTSALLQGRRACTPMVTHSPTASGRRSSDGSAALPTARTAAQVRPVLCFASCEQHEQCLPACA